jgi:hypothetical protein
MAVPLSSASPQQEKQGLQKVVPSEGSSTESKLNQDEWETIPINTLWIYKKKNLSQAPVAQACNPHYLVGRFKIQGQVLKTPSPKNNHSRRD